MGEKEKRPNAMERNSCATVKETKDQRAVEKGPQKVVVKFRHPLFDNIVGPRKKATRPKRKQWRTIAMKKKGTAEQKNTNTGLKMIGADFSFQTKVIFLFKNSIQHLYAVHKERSCGKSILPKQQSTQTKRCFGDVFL